MSIRQVLASVKHLLKVICFKIEREQRFGCLLSGSEFISSFFNSVNRDKWV